MKQNTGGQANSSVLGQREGGLRLSEVGAVSPVDVKLNLWCSVSFILVKETNRAWKITLNLILHQIKAARWQPTLNSRRLR